MKLPIFALLTLLLNFAYAQQSVNYFADNIHTGPNSHIICAEVRNGFIYIGGQSFDSSGLPYTPSLIKLDTTGNTIWTYALNKQTDDYPYYTDAYIADLVTDSTSVFANPEARFGEHKLLKIDQTTGDAIWKKTVKGASIIRIADSGHIIYTITEMKDTRMKC